MKIAEFANSVDLDEVAHHESPHLDLRCLPSSLWILNMIQLGLNISWKFVDESSERVKVKHILVNSVANTVRTMWQKK